MKYIKTIGSFCLAAILCCGVALAFVDSLEDGNETLNIEKTFKPIEENNSQEVTIEKQTDKVFAKVKIRNERQ